MRRPIALTAAALAIALSTTACANEELVASEQSGIQSGPVIDAQRVESFLSEIEGSVKQADETQSARNLTERLTDPALRMRKAQYVVAAATGSPAQPLLLSVGNVALTDTQTWPRTIVNIVGAGNASLPMAFVFIQKDARSSYQLHSWARILGGTTLTIPPVKKGSPTLIDNAEGYLATPRAAFESYVAMLNEGKAENDQHASDEFTSTFLNDEKSLNDAVKGAGKVDSQVALSDSEITGVVLEDGSALVSGAITYTTTYERTVPQSTMRLGGTTAVLAPGDDDLVKGKAVATYVATVLMRIPAKEAGGKISIVGAERALESVVLDPSSNPDN